MTDDNKNMFDILDQFSQRLLIWNILKIFLSFQRWMDLKGMYVYFLLNIRWF